MQRVINVKDKRIDAFSLASILERRVEKSEVSAGGAQRVGAMRDRGFTDVMRIPPRPLQAIGHLNTLPL